MVRMVISLKDEHYALIAGAADMMGQRVGPWMRATAIAAARNMGAHNLLKQEERRAEREEAEKRREERRARKEAQEADRKERREARLARKAAAEIDAVEDAHWSRLAKLRDDLYAIQGNGDAEAIAAINKEISETQAIAGSMKDKRIASGR